MLKGLANSGTATPSGAAGGSLAGTYPNPTIASSVNLPGSPTTTTQTASDNTTKIATTAFVTTAVAGVIGALVYQGTWNANTNTPTLVSSTGTAGFFYIVSVAGTTSLDGTASWKVGDLVIFEGAKWQRVDGGAYLSPANNLSDVASASTSRTNLGLGSAAVENTTAIITDNGGGGLTIGSGQVTGAMIATSAALAGSPTTTTQAAADSSTKIATTAYADTSSANAAAQSNAGDEVSFRTTAAGDTSGLTYLNGVGGIGATFTGSINTPFTADGQTATLGLNVLIANDTQTTGGASAGAFNGIYTVTQIQTIGLPPILTRALSYDTIGEINNLGLIFVRSGTTYAGQSFVLTARIATLGTTAINYSLGGNAAANVALLNGTQTFTGTNTFTNSLVKVLGSSTGATTLTSDNAGASNFTIHIPAANDTLVTLAATQTISAKTITSPTISGGGTADALTIGGTTPAAAQVYQVINAQSGTTYTHVIADTDKLITLSNAGGITFTIDTNANVATPIGSKIDLLQIGAGQVTVAAAGGVTLNSYTAKVKLAGQYAAGSIIKSATNTWYLIGNLA